MAMSPETRRDVLMAALLAENLLIAQATEDPVPDTDVVVTHGEHTLTRVDLMHLINAARGYLPAYKLDADPRDRDLLKRIVEDVVAIDTHYGNVTDSENYRETPASPEELAYLTELRDS